MNGTLGWLLGTIQLVDPVLRTALAGTGMLLETSVLVGLIVPGDTIVIAASTAVTGPLQYFALLAAVVIGALAGESIGFALGRYFGPRIRVSRIGVRIGTEHWGRAEQYLDRRGGIAVFLSRFLPVFHSLVPLTVGMSTMRYRRFIAWTAPACVLWALAYVSVGWVAADRFRAVSGRLHAAGYLFVAAIVLFLVLTVLVKKALILREGRHMQPDDQDDAPAASDE